MKQKNNFRRAAVYGVAGLATAAIGASTANALVDDRPDEKPAQDAAQAARPPQVQAPVPQQQKQVGKPSPRTETAPRRVSPQPAVKPVSPVRHPVAPVVKQTTPQRPVKLAQPVKKVPHSVPVVKKAAAVKPRAVKPLAVKPIAVKPLAAKAIAPKLAGVLADKSFVVRAAVVDPPTSSRAIRKQVQETAKVVDSANEAVEQAGKVLDKAKTDLKKAKGDLEKLRKSVEKLKDHDKPFKIMTGDRD